MKRALILGSLLLVLGGSGGWYVYSRPTTRHCLLVFGPKENVRIRVSMTGQTMSLSHEGADGRLVEVGRFKRLDDCKDVELADPDGRTTYLIGRVSGMLDQPRPCLFFNVTIKGPLA